MISDCNDNSLFSLRNLLLSIESIKPIREYTNTSTDVHVVEETPLAQVIGKHLRGSKENLQILNLFDDQVSFKPPSMMYLLGTVSEDDLSFHETLNTLEFCSKFRSTLITAFVKDFTPTLPTAPSERP
jgi:hypothetical protein